MGAGGGFGQGMGFFLVVMFMFVLALDADQKVLQELASEIIFVAVLLAGLLSFDRVFRRDIEDGTMTQLKLSAYPLALIVAVKALVHWITTGFALLLLTPVIGIVLSMNIENILTLMVTLLFATPAISFVGAIGAALTVSIERASLIQALITLPLFIPILIFGTIASESGPRQISALIILVGLSFMSLILAPWVCAIILKRNQF